MKATALAGLLAAGAMAACGDDESDKRAQAEKKPAASGKTTVVKLRPVTPMKYRFDQERLSVPAGRVEFVLTNPEQYIGHQVRVQTGDKCCFGPGSEDLGGTKVIKHGRTGKGVTADLKPGKYWFFCGLAGHWQKGMKGRLTVR
jgi:plastocyanin